MRLPTIACLATAATALLGCNEPKPVVSPPPETNYADLGAAQLSLSGVVYDPEAFFYSMAMWPFDEAKPDDAPPPALMEGMPYLMNSAIPEATVSLVKGDEVVMTSEPSDPMGAWNAAGVSEEVTAYNLVAEPPEGPIALGAGFPSPPFSVLPEAKYYKTRTLNPVIPENTYCMNQVAISVGNTGALWAIADARSSQGPTTTVEDLLNPTKTGGVLLVWIYSPSVFMNYFTIPSGEISLSADRGEVYAIEWAPPGTFPGQSPLGYAAAPGALSSTGYFAVVLPPRTTAPVHITLKDNMDNPDEGRPFPISDVTWKPTPGVTFYRAFGVIPPPPPDPDAEPVPEYTYPWACDGN